jgi:hypothetical protein
LDINVATTLQNLQKTGTPTKIKIRKVPAAEKVIQQLYAKKEHQKQL